MNQYDKVFETKLSFNFFNMHVDDKSQLLVDLELSTSPKVLYRYVLDDLVYQTYINSNKHFPGKVLNFLKNNAIEIYIYDGHKREYTRMDNNNRFLNGLKTE